MKAPLFCLMLASQLLAPALGASDQFRRFHTHAVNPNIRTRIPPFDCNTHMGRIQEGACKKFNHVIMGDTTTQTAIADVDAICSDRRARTNEGGGNYQSVKEFNLRSCSLDKNQSTQPPYCVYTERRDYGRIVVSCGPRGGGPNHFVRVVRTVPIATNGGR